MDPVRLNTTKWALAAATAAVVTVLWRIQTFVGFSNDHYVHLARAQQILLGAWPVRDFVDPGMPLMYLVSAGARALCGGALATEFAVVAAGFAVAAAATVLCVRRLAPSLAIAAAAVLLQIQASPRTYSYPKLMLYGLAALVIIALAARPSPSRIVFAGAAIAAAFLFRHDHGLFIGVSMAACLLFVSLPDAMAAIRRLALLAATTAVALLPWLLFIERFEGVAAYLRSGVEFSGREADATFLRSLPRFDLAGPAVSMANGQAWLFYLYVALPIVALVLAFRRRGREAWPGESAAVGALAVMAAVVDWGFLRDPLPTRLADAVLPICLLGAWLLGLAWLPRRSSLVTTVAARGAAMAAVVVTIGAMWPVAGTRDLLDRAGAYDDQEAIVSNYHEVLGALGRREHDSYSMPSRISGGLVPFFDYLDDCTETGDRLLVTGQFPDVFVVAGRGFAGGQIAYMQGFYTSREEQTRTLARLRREPVPFALLVLDNQPTFERDFPLIDAYLRERYAPLMDLPIPETAGVRVLVDRHRAPRGRFAQTGWPCFK